MDDYGIFKRVQIVQDLHEKWEYDKLPTGGEICRLTTI